MTTHLKESAPERTYTVRFERWIRHGIARRGAFPFLAIATFGLALGIGLLARLTAHDDFQTFGDGIWWALVTLTTVGYGDIVPESLWGRTMGVGVMVLGVTFISFLTATVTSLFVASEEDDRELIRREREAALLAAVQRIEDRLAAIESRLPNQP